MKVEIRIWNFKKLVHKGTYQFNNDSEANLYALGLYNGFDLAGTKVTGYGTTEVKK